MIKEESVYKIGIIGKAHGIKGEVSIQIDNDVFDRVDAEYLVLKLDGIMVPFFMEEYRFKSDSVVLMKFIGIDTQERARELTGVEVYFPCELGDEVEPEHLTDAQIIGFTIISGDKVVGKIESIDDTTVNTLFELNNGLLIPATDDMVEEIDIENKTIKMNLPAGLLEL